MGSRKELGEATTITRELLAYHEAGHKEYILSKAKRE